MDNSAIEKIGAAQLDIIFVKTGIADPHIKRDEKTMSWDGTVSIFSSVPFSKSNHLGDIPVQVKTHMVDRYYSHIDVEVADLKIYKKEKRVLYLVVENRGDEYKIFYKALFLWDLEKIIPKASEAYWFNALDANAVYGFIWNGSEWQQVQYDGEYVYEGEKELNSSTPFTADCGLVDYSTPNKVTLKISCQQDNMLTVEISDQAGCYIETMLVYNIYAKR